MKYYSQKSYPNVLLGECKATSLAAQGCFVTSLSILSQIEPPKVNEILKKNSCFAPNKLGVKCMMRSHCAATALGLEYHGKSWAYPSMSELPCIGETRINDSQHFFVLLESGKIVDPLDRLPKPKLNTYFIVSYRLFYKLKPKTMEQSLSSEEYKQIFRLAWTKEAFAKLKEEDFVWWSLNVKGGDGMTRILQDPRCQSRLKELEEMEKLYADKDNVNQEIASFINLKPDLKAAFNNLGEIVDKLTK